MKRLYICLSAIISVIASHSAQFKYNFRHTNLAEALTTIAEQHPELQLNFIYNEIDNYKTTTSIDTDNAYQALRQTVGINPVSITNKNNRYYIEALQHGRFTFYGKVLNEENEPATGVSVLLLSPQDSTVVTYGVSDSEGHFSIPCDKKKILAKFTCVGYMTTYINLPQFNLGTIIMRQFPIRLSTVSIEADNTFLTADKNIYIPSARQKNASQDAADLLRRLAIPQLVINPGDNSIRDVFGNNVVIYINSHEARPEELKGMKMTDVRKIEFIEFPTDPRFKGEQKVINFIVQEYEYGGYTKVSESFKSINGLYNSTDIFSRFAYKKMTYDIYAGSDNQNFHHSGSDLSAAYRLEDNGELISVNRTEAFKASDTRQDRYPLTFNATYNSTRFMARNMLSFTHFSSPEQSSSGALSVDLHPEKDYSYSRNTPNRYNTVSYRSNFWGLIGSNASFDITPSFLHTHRNNVSSYKSTLISNPIYNHITENAYNWTIQATGRLLIGKKSQLSLFLAGGQNINRLTYLGTNNTNASYSNSFMAGNLRFRYQIQKFSITSTLGFGLDHNSLNGITTTDIHPNAAFNAWFSINKRSHISAYLSYQTTTPDISMKSNDIVQSNEYLYLTGNPNLKNWRNLNSNLSFNWYCNNSFSLAAFTGYEQDFNRVTTIYRPYDEGRGLLRDFLNDGSFRHYYIGISTNYKLFNNSLQLYANITQNDYETTGAYKDSYFPFRIQLQGIYYWKSFNILASWGNPQNTLTENSNYIIRGRNFHMFSLGWGNGIWTVNLAAKNVFNKGWHSETWQKYSPLYSEYQQFYNPSAHASLNLSVTYTIGYGKKVQRGNEAGEQDNAPSAIIK